MMCVFIVVSQVQTGILNGIDRLNSDGEYDPNNCVTACSICNYMKACLDPAVFVDICEHILTHLGQINGTLTPELFAGCHVGTEIKYVYGDYKCRADKKHLEFSITLEQFDQIVRQPCYLCGKSSVGGHINGVDRYDNTQGYILLNCRPCCGTCNYMKKQLPFDDFVNKLKKINEYNCIWELIDEFDEENHTTDAPSSVSIIDTTIASSSDSPSASSSVSGIFVCMPICIFAAPQSASSNSLTFRQLKAQYLREYRFRTGITQTPHVAKTPEEKREHERLRKQAYREKQKEKNSKFAESQSKK